MGSPLRPLFTSPGLGTPCRGKKEMGRILGGISILSFACFYFRRSNMMQVVNRHKGGGGKCLEIRHNVRKAMN